MNLPTTFADAKTLTAEALKQELHSTLITAVKAAGAMYLHGHTLSACGYTLDAISDYHYSGIPESICANFLKSLECLLSDGNPLTERSPLALEWSGEQRFPSLKFAGLSELEISSTAAAIAEKCVSTLDFESTLNSLNTKLAGLEERVQKGYCADLVKAVCEYEDTCFRRDTKRVADKGRHYLVDSFYSAVSSYNEPYQVKRAMNEFHSLFLYVGGQVCFGFGSAFLDAARASEDLGWNEDFESRTRWGKGMPLQLIYFKSGFKLQVSVEAMDAIQTFIALHGTEEQQHRMIRTRCALGAAA